MPRTLQSIRRSLHATCIRRAKCQNFVGKGCHVGSFLHSLLKKEIRECNARIRDLRDQEMIACHLAGKECVSACMPKAVKMKALAAQA